MNENITPLPWSGPLVTDGDTGRDGVAVYFDPEPESGLGGKPWVTVCYATGDTYDEMLERAEAIVSTANTHPALTTRVKELEGALRASTAWLKWLDEKNEFSEGCGYPIPMDDHDRRAFDACLSTAEAALNKEPTT